MKSHPHVGSSAWGAVLAMAAWLFLILSADADESFTLCCGTVTNTPTPGLLGSTQSNVVVTITDPGTMWLPDYIYLGINFSGNTLNIVNSGLVSTAGSTFPPPTAFIQIGNYTNSGGNQLFLGAGGQLEVTNSSIGWSGSASNTVLLTDLRTVWTNHGNVNVYGSHNSVTISNGAGIFNDISTYIGAGLFGASATNNNVLVIGTNSLWRNTGDFYVGYGGGNNLVMIAGGGTVEDNNGVINGAAGGGNNTVVVTDTNSTWLNHSNLNAGSATTYGLLVITNGGKVLNQFAFVDNTSTAWVTGGGTVWSNLNDLNISSAPFSYYNLMIISNGASVFDANGNLGHPFNSLGNLAIVTDTNSAWINSANLSVGLGGAFNQLIITNGGLVTDANAVIGNFTNLFLFPGFPPPGPVGMNQTIVTGSGSTWSNASSLTIGFLISSNQLVITNGGLVTCSNSTLGFALSSSNNLAIVTGSNVLGGTASHWITLADLVIGNAGAANQLAVSDAALVENRNGILGSMSSSSNNSALIADSLTTWKVKSNLYVGNAGAGNQLAVSNNAQVLVASNGFVGNMDSSSNNLVFVTDPSSFFAIRGTYLYLGYNGTGNWLVISNQGEVKIGEGTALGPSHLSIADQTSSSNNTVLVTGTNSLLSAGLQVDDFQIHVGNQGSGNLLVVTNYGLVISTKGFIGDAVPATGNVAIVTDQGQWRIQPTGSGTDPQTFYVGNNGAQNQLLVTNAGVVTVTNTGATVGFGITSTNNTAIVTGLGSLWDIDKDLMVGESGASNQLYILNDGMVRNQRGIVGDNVATSNNLVRVSGALSLWTNSSDLFIGQNGANNQLLVSSGGDVESLLGYIGAQVTSSNNNVFVMNGPSRWNLRSNLYVGGAGSFNNLVISNGGVINDTNGCIGDAASAQGNKTLVTDLGSIWIHAGDLFIGNTGSMNSLTISNSAAVIDNNANLGWDPAANGNLAQLTDLGSIWYNTNVFVGISGDSNQLTVLNGGLLLCDVLDIGLNSGASNNVVTVTGAQSWLKSLVSVSVGSSGISNQLIVANHGLVTTVTTVVGDTVSSSSNQLTITGTGTLYTNSGTFILGHVGVQNALMVAAGGELLDDTGNIGFLAASSSNVALVTGAGTVWWNTNDLNVGNFGTGNELTVANGALLTSSNGFLGLNPSADDNTVVITDPGSVWNMETNLYVGNAGTGCQITIENGGTLNNTFGYIGFLSGADSNSVTVTGTGSGWNNSSNIYVGNVGSQNQLTISGGGQVSSIEGFLGYSAASSGNSVVVTGAGSRWTLSGGLYIGYGGTNNQFTISSGGVVTVPHSVFIGLESSGNTMTLAVGTLNVVDPTAHASALNVLRGGFFFVNGVLVADQLLLTNGANGFFNFGGGELDTRQTTVSNTLAFTVGNGTNTATLNLLGGHHSFANGVQISSNAFLTGTGTNAGNVSCAGTVSPGGTNSIASLFITSNYTQTASGTFKVKIGGLTAGTQFDQLNVTGMAALAGALNIVFTNGFNPHPGDAFTVLTYGSHSGTFATVNGLRAPNGLLLTAQYNSTNLTLVATNDLSLQSVRLVGTNVSFDISTASGFTYVVEYTGSLNPPVWQTLETVPGDGTAKTVTDPVTSATQRFYRIRIQ
jgi:T5SS/PEP-CTERM-associated repeat protein